MQNSTTILTVCRLYCSGASIREIRARTGLGKGTIAKIRDTMLNEHLDLKKLESKSPEEIERIFYPSSASSTQNRPEPNFEEIYNLNSSSDYTRI
jgi:hypothetical protein